MNLVGFICAWILYYHYIRAALSLFFCFFLNDYNVANPTAVCLGVILLYFGTFAPASYIYWCRHGLALIV